MGTGNGQPVTLSFWVNTANISYPATLSGAASGERCPRHAESYPFTFSVPGSGWFFRTVTIPADPSGGPWAQTGAGIGAVLYFDLGSGSNFRAAPGAWATGDYRAATGAVGFVAASAAVFQITGVKLEIGSVATPFNRQSLAKSKADCQRYYQQIGDGPGFIVGGYNSAASVNYESIPTPVTMRSSPTFAILGTVSYTNCSALSAYWFEPRICDLTSRGDGAWGGCRRLRGFTERGARLMTYTLTANENTIVRDKATARSFPPDPDNVDYQDYLAWLEEGNEPTPYTPPAAAKEG